MAAEHLLFMYAILAPVTRSRRYIRFQRGWRIARDNSLLMVTGAVLALIWANRAPASYARFTEPLHFVVNDVGMVFFFGLAVKEIIEATAPGGALHSLRRGAVPVIAAVGGMVGPALLFLAQALMFGRHDLMGGWAIPTATDIAFSYLVVRALFPPTHPAIPFLLLLAIADDALGLIVLAAFYPAAPIRPALVVVVIAAACGFAWWLRRAQVNSFWPYVLGAGAVSWAGLFAGGFHPALALVPVLPFVPCARRDAGIFVDPAVEPDDALSRFDRWWSGPVEIVLFFFALTNAGVPFGSSGAATWIVLASLLVGKPIGITCSVWIAERAGFHRAPEFTWPDVILVAVAAGVGFTVALFFATAAFPAGRLQDQAKLGALLSVSAGPIAFAIARLRKSEEPGGRRSGSRAEPRRRL
jgi:NhaA family Na+:H+ antiporter